VNYTRPGLQAADAEAAAVDRIRAVVRQEIGAALATRFPNGLSALARGFVTSLAAGLAIMWVLGRR